MKCKRCKKDEAKYDGLCISCSSEDEYMKEYCKDMGSIYRSKHYSKEQTEEYWKKR